MGKKVTVYLFLNEDQHEEITLEGATQIMVSGAEGSAIYTVRDQDSVINVRITGLSGQATVPESGSQEDNEAEGVKEVEPDPKPKDAPPVVDDDDSEDADKSSKKSEEPHKVPSVAAKK